MKGQYVDISITDGAAFYHWIDAQQYLLDGTLPERAESSTGSDNACMNVYQAGDGKYFTLGCAEPWLWEGLCQLIGREDFVAHHYDPPEKQREMYEAFARVFTTRPRDEWLKLLSDINVSVSPVYDFTEMFTDPHFKHRGITVQVDHPKLGKISMLNTPFKFSGTPAVVENSPPLWGEHTREVLSTVLCYSDGDIDQLIQEDVVQ
jgi:crotonobetainyl-CoA:carnitine CoA-transferase CaiB-like acyl-CoA transferase